ncbi:MAG TPA: amino acid permease, partial [Flexilinea sp.]|nr:amino acid permease [Flexilinea sp.]
MEQRKYGLFTAIAMIVGIVIGSGIYFKSYNILYFTGGNILQGVIALCVGAISIIFGCLAVSELASRTDKAGGVITYSDKFWNKKMAIVFGWFHMWIYYPTLTVIIAWISGVYLNILFGWENTLERQIINSVIVIALLFCINMFSAKLGGIFQR